MSFRRASMFAGRGEAETDTIEELSPPEWLAGARDALIAEGHYLAYEDGERVRVVPLEDDWTRVGRSMAAHIRLDDPTVSRRHALIHCERESARILDDRSLNGVFVNGERIEWRELNDGDEVTVGRYRIYYIGVSGESAAGTEEPAGTAAA